jgi:hypothetical protein
MYQNIYETWGDLYVDIGKSRNELCEICFNECGQELIYFKRGRISGKETVLFHSLLDKLRTNK